MGKYEEPFNLMHYCIRFGYNRIEKNTAKICGESRTTDAPNAVKKR